MSLPREVSAQGSNRGRKEADKGLEQGESEKVTRESKLDRGQGDRQRRTDRESGGRDGEGAGEGD